MNVGDKIYCHTTGRMIPSGNVFAYEGRSYTIIRVSSDRSIFIQSEVGDNHHWTIDDKFYDHFIFIDRICRRCVRKHSILSANLA